MKTIGTIALVASVACCLLCVFVSDRGARTMASPPETVRTSSAAVIIAASQTSSAKPEKWGHLTGHFVYGGEPPKPAKLVLNKDIEVCSPFEPHAEQLLINKQNRGIANVVLWLEMPGRRQVPPIHESYAKSAETAVLLTNGKCRFSPHVTLLRTTQKLSLKNEDTIAHNTSAGLKRNLPFNAVTPAGAMDQRSVRKPERKPVKLSCSIHAWMTGWLLVKDHPYMAVADKEGRFTIKNLPAGRWTFQIWHEIPQAITAASRGGKTTEWKKGRVTVTIKEGENDFGEWTLDPRLFE